RIYSSSIPLRLVFFFILRHSPISTLFPYTTLFRSYASGLDAEVIIWIVKNAREEHRSAIEWLNNNMVKEINFFLIELRAYRIGRSEEHTSELQSRFDLVCRLLLEKKKKTKVINELI